ncbi:tetratricopeptide repeat protein [Engelhardtia mirabilis]|uniref:Tetratricopeptide repeat protein n=1 Tax=Engelhardtia mirabilis TaxID=2528011 RepID=A0A518BPR2_9BACT|nr:Tetratricopeptide repeat protein [Planctomycetes bacterium Pla133]QDV03294.1 Tetratricopeptide repeat protein [Planctomycetes bacterium Pla86]
MTANAPAGAAPKEGSNPLELALVALLAIACLLTPYLFSSPTTTGGSVGNELVFDGRELLTQHEVLSAIPEEPGRLFETLTTSWWGDAYAEQKLYRPASSFVLGLGGVVSGERYDPANPGSAAVPYKLFAVSLKVICALLVVELGALLLGSRRRGFIAGLLFATLPVHGEAIFDVAGTAELLCAAFSLAAWTAWLKAGDRPFEKPLALGASLLLLFGAIHAKESAYALPLLFFLGDIGRVREGGFGAGVKHALSKLPALAACAVVIGVSLGLRMAVLGSIAPAAGSLSPIDNPLLDTDPLTRAMNAVRILVGGLGTAVGLNPFSGNWGFSADYSMSQIPVLGAFAPANLGALAVLIAILGGSVLLFKKCRTRASLVLCYFGALLIVSNLFVPIGTIFAERLLFFPTAILALFLAPFLAGLGSIGVIVAVVIALGNGYWTYNRADVWHDNANLWRDTANKTSPDSARAQFNHGVALAREQLYPLAESSFEKALEIAPDFDLARIQQAAALMASFRTEEALVPLRAVVINQVVADDFKYERDPVVGLLNVDLLLFQITQIDAMDAGGDPERHLAWLDGLIEEGYESPFAHLYRAETLSKLGRNAEAEAAFRRSLEIEPTPAAVRGFGSFLRIRGRNEEALALYQSEIGRLGSESTDANDKAASIEFKLQEADLEYLRDPARANQLVSALIEAGGMTPDQLSRALILRAQTRLDLVPASDSLAAATAVADSARDLQKALGTYQGQSEQSYIALYMLVDLLMQQGRVGMAEATILELVAFRRAPVLHGRLGELYANTGNHDKAAEQFELSTSGLADETGAPLDPGIYVRTRMLQLHNLAALGGREAEIAEIIGAERARADAAAASIDAYWSAATGDWSALEAAIIDLRDRVPGLSVQATIGQLEDYRQVAQALAVSDLDLGSLTRQAQLALELYNYPRAKSAIERALDLTPDSDTDGRAFRTSILAQVLERTGNPAGALEALQAVAALEGVSVDGRAFLGEQIERLEALLST